MCTNVKRIALRLKGMSICHVQGDQKVSVHLIITVQKTHKNILNGFSHLP
jgi:hypothetical protein